MNYANYHQSQFDQNVDQDVKYMKRKTFNANPGKKFTEQAFAQNGLKDSEHVLDNTNGHDSKKMKVKIGNRESNISYSFSRESSLPRKPNKKEQQNPQAAKQNFMNVNNIGEIGSGLLSKKSENQDKGKLQKLGTFGQALQRSELDEMGSERSDLVKDEDEQADLANKDQRDHKDASQGNTAMSSPLVKHQSSLLR